LHGVEKNTKKSLGSNFIVFIKLEWKQGIALPKHYATGTICNALNNNNKEQDP